MIKKSRRHEIDEIYDKIAEDTIWDISIPNFDVVRYLKSKDLPVCGDYMPYRGSNPIETVSLIADDMIHGFYNCIIINNAILSRRESSWMYYRRYLLAREYGYIQLYKNDSHCYCHTSYEKDFTRKRNEAEYFARYFLMPTASMKEFCHRDGFKAYTKKEKCMSVALAFGVPIQIAKKRLKELNEYK